MKKLDLIFLLLAVLWTLFLALGTGSVPPLGPVLEVRYGVWAHRHQPIESGNLPGLKHPVTVTFDANGVPHFFAQDESDLFLAQGYVMASQRLFQMDLMTRITAGRLAEWVGEKALKYDRFFVRFGMRESVRRALERYNEDARVANILSSFTAGVNAYIQQLRQLPPEYIILNAKPELWTAERVIHMGKQLTFGLAGRSFDHYLSMIQQALGIEKVLDLFPEFTALDDIIYPSKGARRRLETAADFDFVTSLKDIPFLPLPEAGNGSNNWAVSAKRSVTGTSIMANDTHLAQTLPNVWYESQLCTPGFNVYGVGLAGIPGIINGMNSKVSWGPTNGTTDVLDYFEVDLNAPSAVTESQYEMIFVRRGRPEKIEVKWTRFGVIVHEEGGKGLAAAWRGHSTENELRAIYSLYESKTLDDCLKAFIPWSAPVQNFICADRKDVAIQPVGFLPKRSVGEGRFVMLPQDQDPLSKPLSETERPRLIRPADGVVLSANQRQTGSESPYYLGWDYEEPFRGAMIRRRLAEKEKFSAEDMIRIQNDSYNLIAELALPKMLAAVDEKVLDEKQKAALKELREWRYMDLAGSRAPAVFYEWFFDLKADVFGDEYKVQASDFYPKDTRLIELLNNLSKDPKHPDKYWADNRDTEEVENLSLVVTKAFQRAWEELRDDQGRDPATWTFKKFIKTRIPHAARLPGFGSEILTMDGGPDAIRGNKGRHGGVYKFVAVHGDWPEAWIQVPGGNEGDPFSRDFERFATDWAEGKMRKVNFYRDEAEARAAAVKTVELRP